MFDHIAGTVGAVVLGMLTALILVTLLVFVGNFVKRQLSKRKSKPAFNANVMHSFDAAIHNEFARIMRQHYEMCTNGNDTGSFNMQNWYHKISNERASMNTIDEAYAQAALAVLQES